jgi:hypothetical protein
MSTYLYGVARPHGRVSRSVLGSGVGDPPTQVYLLRHRDLAALASAVQPDEIGDAAGIRGIRRDMAAHAQVLNRLLEACPVLPARFGVVLPSDEELIERLLAPQHVALMKQLDRVDGAVELKVKADYVQEQVLREVVTTQPQVAGRVSAGATYQQRIEVGRRIAAAIQARRERDGQWLIDRLRPFARDIASSPAASDMNVLNASFLVAADQIRRFDQRLESVQAEAGPTVRLDCVGPLPPYSFVDLRL